MIKSSKVIAIMNRKGGVGKTTTAINLAHGLSLKLDPKFDSVLLIDLDPQGSVYQSLNPATILIRYTLSDVLLGHSDVNHSVFNSGKLPGNFWFIPSDDSLITAKVALLTQDIAGRVASGLTNTQIIPNDISKVLSKHLNGLRKTHPFIILDCPPSLDFLANAVYDFADMAIVPVKPDYLSSYGTVQHTQNIVQAQTEGYKITIECFLPTFFRSREILARKMLQSLRDTYGSAKIAKPIPQAVAIEQAPAANGQTIFEYAPDSPAAAAYESLVSRILRKYYA